MGKLKKFLCCRLLHWHNYATYYTHPPYDMVDGKTVHKTARVTQRICLDCGKEK
jgi:hypothetical protein